MTDRDLDEEDISEPGDAAESESPQDDVAEGIHAGVQRPEDLPEFDVDRRARSLAELDSGARSFRWADYLPVLSWATTYRVPAAAADLLAGSLVALLLLPQAMAYAQLAGLPPRVGFYAALLPTLGYSLFGSARFLSIGPVALVSLLASESLNKAVESGYSDLDAALILAAVSGLTLVVGALLGMARLADFLGRPVLDGFATAAALLIASSQLRPFLGVEGDRVSGFVERIRAVIGSLSSAHGTTTLLGLACLAALLLGAWALPKLAATLGAPERIASLVGRATPLLVLSACCAAVFAFDLRAKGVAVVGDVALGVPPVGLPPLDLDLWRMMLPGGLVIALVSFVIGLALGQSLADREDRVEPRQELLGIGMANVFGSLTGSYPVGASVSRSSVLKASGARSPLAALLAGILALSLAFLAAPVVALLPKAALAALILTAALGMIDFGKLRRSWKIDRMDGISLVVTFGAVLVLGVDRGLVLGVVTGLVLSLWQNAHPRVVLQGWKKSSRRFASSARESVEMPEVDPILLARIDGALNFSNSRHVRQRLFVALSDHPAASCLLLDLSSVHEIDGTSFLMLEDLIRDVGQAGVLVAFSQPKLQVLEKMREGGLIELLGQDLWFDSTEEAIKVMKIRCQQLSFGPVEESSEG